MIKEDSPAALDLANRRTKGKPGPLLTDEFRPKSFDEAFSLQQEVGRFFGGVSVDEVAGWKCAAPNDDELFLAALYDSTLQYGSNNQTSLCKLYPDLDGHALVEPELAFELRHDLPARDEPYSRAEIDEAIGATRLALELIQSRYESPEKASFLEKLADGLVNQGVWFGPELSQELTGDLTKFLLTIQYSDGQQETKEAKHPNGHPRSGLYWLVNFLSEQGIGLHRGQQVITGSYAGLLKLPMDQTITLSYGDLGSFFIQFEHK